MRIPVIFVWDGLSKYTDDWYVCLCSDVMTSANNWEVLECFMLAKGVFCVLGAVYMIKCNR